LLICLAPEIDRKYDSLFAYLQNDITRKKPSLDLLLTLACSTLDERLAARNAFDPRAPLLKYHLLETMESSFDGPVSLLSRSAKLDDRAASFLLGGQQPDAQLYGVAQIFSPQNSSQSLPVDSETHQVVSSPDLAHKPTIQRNKEEDEEKLQMKPMASAITPLTNRSARGSVATADKQVETTIEQSRGTGEPLAEEFRQRMERSLGADFRRVRVHTDDNADRVNRSLGSRAFTNGAELFFKRGEYNFRSFEGQRLIAHELVHTIQQNRATSNLIQREDGDPEPNVQEAVKPKPKVYSKEEAETLKVSETKYIKDINDFLSKQDKPLAKKYMSELFKKYKSSWDTFFGIISLGFSLRKTETLNYENDRKKITTALTALNGLDTASNALDAKANTLKGLLDLHRKIEPEVNEKTYFSGKPLWLLSYSQDKKQEMANHHGHIKPIIAREDEHYTKLLEAKKGLDQIKVVEEEEDVKVSGAEKIATAKTATANVPTLQQNEALLFTQATEFITGLETAVDTGIDNILSGATEKQRDNLDITTEEIKVIKKDWIKKLLYKNKAEERVTEAAGIQRKPTKEAWFTKLGLIHKEEKYNWVEAETIGGDNVHETLYRDTITETDVIQPGLEALQDLILGTGINGYHVSLENPNNIAENSHGFRKGRVSIKYDSYRARHPAPAGLIARELKAQLKTKRDTCVTKVEGLVKDARDEKGKGMMTTKVVEKLKE
jgi:hypothetical protein